MAIIMIEILSLMAGELAIEQMTYGCLNIN